MPYLIFLVELGLAMTLVAGGAHFDCDLGVGWAALLPVGLMVLIFLTGLDTGLEDEEKGESATSVLLVSMMMAGMAGIYGAPVVYVATASWVSALMTFGASIGLIVLMMVSGIVISEIESKLRSRESDGR